MRGERQTEERFPVATVYTQEDRVIFASDGLLLGAIVLFVASISALWEQIRSANET